MSLDPLPSSAPVPGARVLRRRLAAWIPALVLASPLPAPAGPFDEPGHEPAAIVAWATSVDDFVAGFVDIAHPELGRVDFGLPELALGPASLDAYDVVSLGDGGEIVLGFEGGIGDGPGDDFAVWENGFYAPGGLFAELAFVEVSTNGVDFARFAPQTLNTFPAEAFDTIDPSDYRNLAGDQPVGLGTGFDLAELASDPLVAAELVDLADVRFVRLVDVIGDGSTSDALGEPVFDPYPTPYPSGGFDLEAVGVLHEAPEPGLAAGIATGVLALACIRRGRATWGRDR